MEEAKMMCLESLQGDIDGISDESARKCLTNFITLCSALYATEAEEDHASQEVVSKCRRQMSEVHKKSLRLLEALLNSESSHAPDQVDTVLKKMRDLADVHEALNLNFGPEPALMTAANLRSGEHEQRLAEVSTQDKATAANVTTGADALIADIVKGLESLADVILALRKEEREARAINRKLSQRLECLRQEAGCHPAIKAYTARNCRSPLVANARREEYMQYACALERVIKKVRKATEALRASGQNDLAALEKHLPALRTLSHSLAQLHTQVQDACMSPDPAMKLDTDTPEPPERRPARGVVEEETGPVAEKLNYALASVGSVRRCVDAGLAHVSALLGECAGDWDAHLSAEGAVAQTTGRPASEGVCAGALMTPGGDDLLAIDTLKFLPLEEKKCREHLMGGTKLLRSAVEDLTQAIEVKSSVIEAHSVLDNALCRPFPETSICRLELIRLLTAQQLPEFQSPPVPKANHVERPCASKVPKAEENKRRGQASKSLQSRKLNSPDHKRRKGTSPSERKRQSAQVHAKKEAENTLQVSGLRVPNSVEGKRRH